MRKEYEKRVKAILRRKTRSPYQVVQKMEDVLKLREKYTEGQLIEFDRPDQSYRNKKRKGAKSNYKNKDVDLWRASLSTRKSLD